MPASIIFYMIPYFVHDTFHCNTIHNSSIVSISFYDADRSAKCFMGVSKDIQLYL